MIKSIPRDLRIAFGTSATRYHCAMAARLEKN